MKTYEEGYALGWADAIYAYESKQRKNKNMVDDAKRYRWLRDIGNRTWIPFVDQWLMDSQQCDAVIDTAINSNSTEEI